MMMIIALLKTFICVKDSYEAKYQYSIKKRENNGLENL